MVWGVCRRLLRTYHDAEDALQATFLVLVQKATTLSDKELVGNWLYGVAQQTAVRMRTIAAKRGVRERQVAVIPEPAVSELDIWNDLQPVLDQELSRLPTKSRVLVVLCDMESKTRKEVAQQLGVPEGTVAGRLARARALLAARLARGGIVVSGGLLAAILSQQAASGCVPEAIFSSTIKTATRFAAGQAAAMSPTVAALMTGVMKAMCVTKIKSVVAVTLSIGLGLGMIGLGVSLFHDCSQGAELQEVKTKDVLQRGDKPPATDKNSLQGEWVIVGIEEGGKQASKSVYKDEAKYHKVIVKGDKLLLHAGTEIEKEHTFTLDQSKKVKEIDLVRDGIK